MFKLNWIELTALVKDIRSYIFMKRINPDYIMAVGDSTIPAQLLARRIVNCKLCTEPYLISSGTVLVFGINPDMGFIDLLRSVYANDTRSNVVPFVIYQTGEYQLGHNSYYFAIPERPLMPWEDEN
jgi:hypothetical protein